MAIADIERALGAQIMRALVRGSFLIECVPPIRFREPYELNSSEWKSHSYSALDTS